MRKTVLFSAVAAIVFFVTIAPDGRVVKWQAGFHADFAPTVEVGSLC